jgi:hypothetical protein
MMFQWAEICRRIFNIYFQYMLYYWLNNLLYFCQIYFGTDMFRIDLLSIVRSLNTVYKAIGICHASYVDCLLASSGLKWAFQNFENVPTKLKKFVSYTRIL